MWLSRYNISVLCRSDFEIWLVWAEMGQACSGLETIFKLKFNNQLWQICRSYTFWAYKKLKCVYPIITTSSRENFPFSRVSTLWRLETNFGNFLWNEFYTYICHFVSHMAGTIGFLLTHWNAVVSLNVTFLWPNQSAAGTETFHRWYPITFLPLTLH